MKKSKQKLNNLLYLIHYFLSCLELGIWKLWADLTSLIKHRKLPRKRTPEELIEASRLIRTWMKRDRKKGNEPKKSSRG